MRKKWTQDETKKRLLILEKETLRNLAVTGGGRLHIPTGSPDDTSGCDTTDCSA
jgi:hypothetical protein